MKIAPRAAVPFLSQPDKGYVAALLYGPDNGLVRERSREMIAKLLPAGYDPLALVEFTSPALASDPALLADELSAISMMAPKRVIVIRDADDKSLAAITSAESAMSADAYLIVCGGDLPGRSALRAWFEKAPRAACLACYHDEAAQIQTVLRKGFEDARIRVGADVIDFLAHQLGNDRYVTLQEMHKLITYAGSDGQLSLEDARKLVDYNHEASFDDASNALADRNLQALEAALALLQREGMQPVAYLRAMQRYFHKLYTLKTQMKNKTADEVIQAQRPPVFFRQVPILQRHLQSWNINALSRALALLLQAELACKSSDVPPLPASTRRLFQVTQLR